MKDATTVTGAPPTLFGKLTGNDYRAVKIIAAVTGLLGFLLAAATPLLPVTQRTNDLSWPQRDVVSNITAPMVSFVPVSTDVSVPCALVGDLPKSGGVLLSTVPAAGKQASARGLFVKADAEKLSVTLRDVLILSADRSALRGTDCSVVLHGDGDGVTASIKGATGDKGQLSYATNDHAMRPQIVGVFSDLPADAPRAGLSLTARVDTRFVNSPTALKLTAIIVGILMTLLSLIALGLLDARDGHGHQRFLPRGWFTIRGPDVVVFVVLALWWFMGGNTSDDGYNITVARITEGAGYADNYFRYFGVPQDPFGWPYQVLSWMTQFSVATPWLRLPAFLLGLLGWWLISREVIPRLGRTVRNSSAAVWSGALVFLAIWLPYNNGIRFEPVEAVGALLTWCCVERAIATRRLLPYAVAATCGAFTLAVAPGGLMAVAALLAGLRPVVRGIVARRKRDGLLPILAPVLAAGTAVLFMIFYAQPLASLIEGSTVASEVGPTQEWTQEPVRYYYLILQTGDGTLARRYGILIMLLCLVIAIFRLLSRRHPNGVARAPIWRLIAVMLGTMFFIAFTPTKWTHHFGVYAGIGAAVAAATAAMMAPVVLRSRRNRTFFATAVLAITAISFAGTNMWWYVGSYGIPWWDQPPAIAGIKLSWVVLATTMVTATAGLWFHLRDDYVDDEIRTGMRREGLSRFKFSPLPVISALVIVFILASFVKGAWVQRDSWSWAKSNARALTGDVCGLANDVLVEEHPSADFLTPAGQRGKPAPSAAAALGATNSGFTPTGLPSNVYIDPLEKSTTDDSEDEPTTTAPTVDEQTQTSTEDPESSEVAEAEGKQVADKNKVRLPFGFDPATTPVLGSYGTDTNSTVTTSWYSLGFAAGEAPDTSPLVTVAAAGSIQAIDSYGVVVPGRKLAAEYGRLRADGSVTPLGERLPVDSLPSSDWRDLRFPLSEAPAGANVVRLQAVDDGAASKEWLAFTGPRLPKLRTLNEVVGTSAPVFIDWLPGLVFPCQRPMAVDGGILELPEWRIMPDADGTRRNSQTWMAGKSGGPLGITDALLHNTLVPTYLRNNWGRDWGGLERFTPIVPNTEAAQMRSGYQRVSGLYNPAPMRWQGY